MIQPILTAKKRESTSKGSLNLLRNAGNIPAVIYNRHGKSTPISLDGKEFARQTEHVSESTIFKLKVDGTDLQALLKERQLDWMRGQIVHVDFFEVEADQTLRAKVAIHLLGIPIGVKEGGILENPAHDLEVECLPRDLPQKFEVDISGLQANHSLHVRDITPPAGVKIMSSGDLVIAVVKYAKIEVEPVVEAAVVDEATAAAAAGAAPVSGTAPAGEKPADEKAEKGKDKK